MAHLLIIIAMCIAATMACPSMQAIQIQLYTIDDQSLATCAESLIQEVDAALKASLKNAKECAAESHDEIVKLEKELEDSITKAAAAVKEQVDALHACNGLNCKVTVVKKIVEIIVNNVKENTEIVKAHLDKIEETVPAAATCVRGVFRDLLAVVQKADQDFIKCVLG